jgi:hypothetical protein
VWFPPGSDPAVFKVTSLPGALDVEVCAEDDGSASCLYTGRTKAEADKVIGRLPVPGHPQIQAITADTLTATWDGVAVEWHYFPPENKAADQEKLANHLLAHLGILRDRDQLHRPDQ